MYNLCMLGKQYILYTCGEFVYRKHTGMRPAANTNIEPRALTHDGEIFT